MLLANFFEYYFFHPILSIGVFLFVLTPIYILRLILTVVSKISKQYKLIDVGSAWYVGWPFSEISSGSVLVHYRFSGKHEPTSFHNIFHELTKIYPEYTRYPSTFCGFPCWENEENFSIKDHIFLYNLESETKDLLEVTNVIAKAPFPERRSPWLLYLFNVAQNPESSYAILKLHHCLGDGNSLFKSFLGMDTIQSSAKVRKKPSFLNSAFLNIGGVMKVAVNSYPLITRAGIQTKEIPKFYMATSQHGVNVNKIKEIKNKMKTSFTVVTLAALSVSLKSHFARFAKTTPSASSFPVFVPVPSFKPSKESSKMTNNL